MALVRLNFFSIWCKFESLDTISTEICTTGILVLFVLSSILHAICSIHKGFCLHQGFSSPITDLTERLLLEERDPPATPQESLSEAPPFDEVRYTKNLFRI